MGLVVRIVLIEQAQKLRIVAEIRDIFVKREYVFGHKPNRDSEEFDNFKKDWCVAILDKNNLQDRTIFAP